MTRASDAAPLVSIVLPTHNRAALLARSIRSVLRQTVTDFELLIVDDASTDNTVEVLESFSDPRICVIRFDANQGVSAARNAGLDSARGRFIAFQDSDDEWLPEKLERQLTFLEKNPDADMVFCSLLRIDTKTRRARLKPDAMPSAEAHEFMRELLRLNFIWTQTWLVRAQVFSTGLRFNTGMKRMVDWDLALLIQQRGRIGYLPDVLAIAYVTEGSLVSDQAQRGNALKLLLKNHAAAYEKYPRVYALHCRTMAVWSAEFADAASARAWAWQALRLAPATPKSILVWLLAMTGKPVLAAVSRFMSALRPAQGP